MNKIFTQLFISLFICAGAFAQIPNPSFENWQNYLGTCAPAEVHPISWQTSDSITVCYSAGQSAVREGINKCGGLYSIKLISVTSIVGVVPGFATNGSVTGVATVVGGTPDTARSQQFSGCYGYHTVNNDTGYISAYLFRWNGSSRDTIASAIFMIKDTTASMVPFLSNFVYKDWSHEPDSILIILTSTPGLQHGHAGSVLYVDTLELSGYVGIDENTYIRNIAIYPQPAQNEITIQVELNRSISINYEIADITGRRILSGKMESSSQKIDISKLNRGNYFVALRSQEGAILHTSKLVVSK